ncbi:MAG: hypothetical protein AB7G75_37030, partial [Candidatus Binatia bacterium]
MSLKIDTFPNFMEKLLLLGLQQPERIAILPRNITTAQSREELLYENSTPTIRVLLRQAGVTEDRLEGQAAPFPTLAEKDASLILPMIFISAAALSQNPAAVSLALSVLANYITEFFKGFSGQRRVKFRIIVETNPTNSYKSIEYDGAAECPSGERGCVLETSWVLRNEGARKVVRAYPEPDFANCRRVCYR